MAEKKPLGLGLIGCGAFGEFCLDAYASIDGVVAAAVADLVPEAADRLGKMFNVPAFHTTEELIACDAVGLVHIATPPSTHHELALAALQAGKHVLCEKPLATAVADADALVAAAGVAEKVAPVNFVLRYNRITDAVKAVINSGLLGQVLSARLTNCAADSNLPPKHWFWNRQVSGGIFIEHGVHFFDLYRHWFGPGEVISAHTETREGTDQQDRVMCMVRHESGVVASHYHGFDQVGPMDRTDHRLVCELGDIRVDQWIPITMTIDAALGDAETEQLAQLLPGAKVQTLDTVKGGHVRGRGKRHAVHRKIRLVYEPRANKQDVYTESVQHLLADQLAFIANPSHPRRVTETNGRDAVADACRSVELAAR